MGLVNTVVPTAELEREAVAWCREMNSLSPLSLRLLKSSFNADEDGITGHPAALPRRDAALLHVRGGPGGPQRLPGGPRARTSRSSRGGPERLTDERAAHLGRWPRGRGRCRPRWRRCFVGSAAAVELQRFGAGDAFRWGTFLAALIGAIFIQIGTNLANDYSDAKRGADTE